MQDPLAFYQHHKQIMRTFQVLDVLLLVCLVGAGIGVAHIVIPDQYHWIIVVPIERALHWGSVAIGHVLGEVRKDTTSVMVVLGCGLLYLFGKGVEAVIQYNFGSAREQTGEIKQ